MKIIEIINLLSCLTILKSSIYLLFVHFASPKSKLDKHLGKFQYFMLKIGLILMAMGTLWTEITLTKVQTSQVILNLGLALYMLWNSLRLDKFFVVDEKNSSFLQKVDPQHQDFPDSQQE